MTVLSIVAVPRWRDRPISPPTRLAPGRAQGAPRLSRSDGMATKESARGHVLRTRAVLVAGVIDFTVGIAVLVASLGLLASRGSRDALPLGLAIFVAGFILVLTGLGRMTARLEITQSCVVWTWAFSRHEVPLTELEDAAPRKPRWNVGFPRHPCRRKPRVCLCFRRRRLVVSNPGDCRRR